MAERARAKKKAAKGTGRVPSRGTVATLPKSAKAKGKKKPDIGHNSGMHKVPDEVYDRHLAKINSSEKSMQKAKAEYDQARGVHQSAFKAAKNDGCNIDAIRLARKLDSMDHGAVVTDYADVGRVLNLMKSPLGSQQMDLFGSITPPEPPVDAALQGQMAGRNGEPAQNNPHTPGTENFTIWAENWVAGQGQLQDGIGKSGTDATKH